MIKSPPPAQRRNALSPVTSPRSPFPASPRTANNNSHLNEDKENNTNTSNTNANANANTNNSMSVTEDILQLVVKQCNEILADCKSLVGAARRGPEDDVDKLESLIAQATRTTLSAIKLLDAIGKFKDPQVRRETVAGRSGNLTVRERAQVNKFGTYSRELQLSVKECIQKSVEILRGVAPLSNDIVDALNKKTTEVGLAIQGIVSTAQSWAAEYSRAHSPTVASQNELVAVCVRTPMRVKELSEAAETRDPKFVEKARLFGTELNKLVVWAKESGCVVEEILIRNATCAFLLAAKTRFQHANQQQQPQQKQQQQQQHKQQQTKQQQQQQTQTQTQTQTRTTQAQAQTQAQASDAEATAAAVLETTAEKVNEVVQTILQLLQSDGSAPEVEEPKEDVKKKLRMRVAAIRELRYSEAHYYTQLKTIIYDFVTPLMEPTHKLNSLITGKNALIAKQFSSLRVIADLTKNILESMKREHINESEEDRERLGEAFLKIAPALKVYQAYINNYELMCQRLNELRKGSPATGNVGHKEFQEFVQKFCLSAKQPDLSFFLILPIQRLPRYEMLFASIFKYTPPSHPDYQNLERCLEKVKDINDEINEKKRIEDNKRKLFEVQTSIYAEHDLQLYQMGRIYIREGTLEEMVNNNKKKKLYYYFLFNDFLLKTKPIKGERSDNKSYMFRERFDFERVCLADNPNELKLYLPPVPNPKEKDKDKDSNNSKQGKGMIYTLDCPNATDRAGWFKAIRDTVNLFKLGVAAKLDPQRAAVGRGGAPSGGNGNNTNSDFSSSNASGNAVGGMAPAALAKAASGSASQSASTVWHTVRPRGGSRPTSTSALVDPDHPTTIGDESPRGVVRALFSPRPRRELEHVIAKEEGGKKKNNVVGMGGSPVVGTRDQHQARPVGARKVSSEGHRTLPERKE